MDYVPAVGTAGLKIIRMLLLGRGV